MMEIRSLHFLRAWRHITAPAQGREPPVLSGAQSLLSTPGHAAVLLRGDAVVSVGGQVVLAARHVADKENHVL